jgi:hypothetical protein
VGRQWEKLDIAIALVGVLVGVAVLAMAVIVVPDQYGMAITILLTAGGYLAMRESLGDSRQAQVTVNRALC